MVGDELAEVVYVTPLPTKGLHQHEHTGVVFDHQVQHHLVEVRVLVPTGAARDVHDVLIRLLVTVVAPIDMQTGAIEMGKAGGKAWALGNRVAAMRL